MAEAKRATLLALSVMFGLGVIKSFIVDGQPPTRRFVLGNAVVAGMLTGLTDLNPTLGKSFAYAVITGSAYAYIPPVADSLNALDKAAAAVGKGKGKGAAAAGAAGDTVTVATGDTGTGAGMKGIDFLRMGSAPGVVARRQNTRQLLQPGGSA